MNVAADLEVRAEQGGWSSAPAFHDRDRSWTHGEVHDLAARAATVLGDLGVEPGSRVVLALPDGIGWVVGFLAIARAGATAVLVNPALPAADHAFIARDSDAVLCLTETTLRGHFTAQPDTVQSGVPQPGVTQSGVGEPDVARSGVGEPDVAQSGVGEPDVARSGVDEPDAGQSAAGEAGAGRSNAVRPGGRLEVERAWADIEDVLRRARGAAPARAWPAGPRSPLYLQYTSGTTGEPKGVVHHHGDLPVYHEAVGQRVLGIGATDVALSVSKLFFAYGFGNAFVFPLYTGSSAVLIAERPTPETIAEAVRRHGVTLLYAVPSAYAALVDRADPAAFGTVRAAVSAGEALPPALGERATILLGAPVCEQIGSTEAGHAFCANSPDDNVPGTLGRPVPGYEVELRDPRGEPVPDGATGEMWVRGPTLLREYLDRPAETARTLVDGWLSTRDLACRQPGGGYRHLGRVDDMEMVGGITVSPMEVERLLAEHPAVREVAVAAVPDLLGATKLRAYVVPAGPVSDAAGLESELIGLARQRLAPFKVPRTVAAVPELPRTATGKLRRHIVRTGTW